MKLKVHKGRGGGGSWVTQTDEPVRKDPKFLKEMALFKKNLF